MLRVFDHWFECEDGHVIAGSTTKKKCDAELWQLHYVKGKRKKEWIGETTKADKPCGKPIIATGDIPPELNYFEVWDHRTMHAFLIGQKFDAHFMIGLQKAFKELKDGKETTEVTK